MVAPEAYHNLSHIPGEPHHQYLILNALIQTAYCYSVSCSFLRKADCKNACTTKGL